MEVLKKPSPPRGHQGAQEVTLGRFGVVVGWLLGLFLDGFVDVFCSIAGIALVSFLKLLWKAL